MSVQFPVAAKVRSTLRDVPRPPYDREIGVFDRHGLWVSFGSGGLSLPSDQLDFGIKIAGMLNAAYEQGRCDQAREIRDAISYGDNT